MQLVKTLKKIDLKSWSCDVTEKHPIWPKQVPSHKFGKHTFVLFSSTWGFIRQNFASKNSRNDRDFLNVQVVTVCLGLGVQIHVFSLGA